MLRKFGAEPQPEVHVDSDDEQGLTKHALHRLALADAPEFEAVDLTAPELDEPEVP